MAIERRGGRLWHMLVKCNVIRCNKDLNYNELDAESMLCLEGMKFVTCGFF